MKIDLNKLDLKGSIESVENLQTGYAGILLKESYLKITIEALKKCKKIDECKG